MSLHAACGRPRGTKQRPHREQDCRAFFVWCHDLHREHDQGLVSFGRFQNGKDKLRTSATEEAGQPEKQTASARKNSSEQQDKKSSGRDGCAFRTQVSSEMSEETPKFRSRFNSQEHGAAAYKFSTGLICRSFLPERAGVARWPGSCDVKV